MPTGGQEVTVLSEDLTRSWYVVWTRSRHEKSVEETLAEQGLQVFLPLISKTRQWSDRKKTVLFPLFPGYLFVRVYASEFKQVHGTRGVVRILGNGSQPSPVPEETINGIDLMVSSPCPVELYPSLPVGCEVIVRKGPLTGARGILVEWKNAQYVVVAVDQLLGGAAVMISPDDVNPA